MAKKQIVVDEKALKDEAILNMINALKNENVKLYDLKLKAEANNQPELVEKYANAIALNSNLIDKHSALLKLK